MGLLNMLQGFFKKKQKLRAIFFDETGSQFKKDVVYENNKFKISEKLFGKKGVYIVDNNFVLYDRKTRIPISYYYANNPNPIHIKHERNADLDSIGFKKMLDSKVITELFSNDGIKFLTIILILVIILLLINLGLAYGAYKTTTGMENLINITLTKCG